MGRQKRLVVAAAALVLAAVAIGGTAVAAQLAADVKTFTGCLAAGDGVVVKVKEGPAPKSACSSGQTLVRISGGDITRITVTGGLSGGGDNGDITIGLDPAFSLPQSCAAGRVAEWNGSAWVCGTDDDTTYTAGTGLDLSASDAFSIEPGYRVKNAPDCASGRFATGFDDGGEIICGAPAATGASAFATTANGVTLAGRTSVLSKTLPAGLYVVHASVELVNKDLDSGSWGSCDLSHPGGTIYATGVHAVDDVADYDSLSLTGAFTHTGGAVLLACTETQANVDVETATLVAIKVDSIG